MDNIAPFLHLIVLIIVGGGLLALWIAAVVSIVLSRLMTPVVTALWILAVIAFPFVGPIVWFAVSSYQRRHTVEAGPIPAA